MTEKSVRRASHHEADFGFRWPNSCAATMPDAPLFRPAEIIPNKLMTVSPSMDNRQNKVATTSSTPMAWR